MGGPASATEWPLVIPVKKFGIIPYLQGMDFFIDTWDILSPPQGGPMIVTQNTLESGEISVPGYRYRVIYEGLNFVLVFARSESTKPRIHTQFMIFTAQSLGQPVTKKTVLRLHSCDYDAYQMTEAFDWPVEKLLETFKKSRCLTIIDIDGSANFGWGDSLYQRAGVWN